MLTGEKLDANGRAKSSKAGGSERSRGRGQGSYSRRGVDGWRHRVVRIMTAQGYNGIIGWSRAQDIGAGIFFPSVAKSPGNERGKMIGSKTACESQAGRAIGFGRFRPDRRRWMGGLSTQRHAAPKG